jgi:hypothetical protein
VNVSQLRLRSEKFDDDDDDNNNNNNFNYIINKHILVSGGVYIYFYIVKVFNLSLYRVIYEEGSMFLEVIISVFVRKKLYESVCNSESRDSAVWILK